MFIILLYSIIIYYLVNYLYNNISNFFQKLLNIVYLAILYLHITSLSILLYL